MDFGWAIKQLKSGARVARAGWNGKGMWIGMQVPDEHSEMGHAYLFISTPDGTRVPWVTSQMDVLAEDWSLAAP